MTCRICGHAALNSVWDFGPMPNVNALHAADRPTTFHPLHLVECDNCGFWQLKDVPHKADVFPPAYPYRSATTKELLDNFDRLVEDVVAYAPMAFRLVDIGGNDGSLLRKLGARYPGAELINVEPTQAGAESGGDTRWVNAFWSEATAKSFVPEPADVITATNVFAHANDLHDMAKAVAWALKPDGLFVVEVQDRRHLVFDTIYHEHVGYYRPLDLAHLMLAHGFEAVFAYNIPTHGGSFRMGFRRAENPTYGGINFSLSAAEMRVNTSRQIFDIQQGVARLRQTSNKVYAIGAPSRATTLLHATGIHTMLRGVGELPGSPKIGLNMPGTRLPVLPQEAVLKEAEHVVILSWHLADNIAARLKAAGYGGYVWAPLPEWRHIG